jgi:hypothetical protein
VAGLADAFVIILAPERGQRLAAIHPSSASVRLSSIWRAQDFDGDQDQPGEY